MFSQACVIPSVHGGVLASQNPSQTDHTTRGICFQRGLHRGDGQTPPRYMGNCGIRSTSRQYASYWNAFLLNWNLIQNVGFFVQLKLELLKFALQERIPRLEAGCASVPVATTRCCSQAVPYLKQVWTGFQWSSPDVTIAHLTCPGKTHPVLGALGRRVSHDAFYVRLWKLTFPQLRLRVVKIYSGLNHFQTKIQQHC